MMTRFHLFLILLHALFVTAVPAVIRSDDFESYMEGIAGAKLPSSGGGVFQQDGRWWAIPTAPHVMAIAVTTGITGNTTKAFHYRKTGELKAGGVLQIMGTMPRVRKKYCYEASIRNGDDTSSPFHAVTYAGIRFQNNGAVVCMSSDGRTELQIIKNAYPVGKWFRFKAEFDIPSDSAIVSINGETLGTLGMPKGTLSNFINPRWDFGGYGTKDCAFWLDDVLMTDADDPGTPISNAASIFSTPANITSEDAFGFEREGVWVSIPPDLISQMERSGNTESDLACARAQNYRDIGIVSNIPLRELAGGVHITREFVRQGQLSGKWGNHCRYPSIICSAVPSDWSSRNTFSISINSAVATGEIITLGILSDNPATPWKDWFFFRFSVDWTGEKRLAIPFTAFSAYEQPLGWSNIGAIAFFTKAFGFQPDPNTVLWLDDIILSYEKPVSASVKSNDTFMYRLKNYEKSAILNHSFPELPPGINPVISQNKAITHGYYFNYERAMYGYNPRFQPGYVSIAPSGKAYVWAGDRIQWIDGNGQWTFSDLAPVIAAWGKSRGWTGIRNGWGSQGCDPMIRFDSSGDVYVLANVTMIDENDKELSWTNRTALLLHTRDNMRTWQVYKLPGGRLANFEKLDGHNTDCLAHPPVILNGDISYFPGTDTGAYLVLPEKNADGTLHFDGPYKYAENAIVGNFHSGDGNVAVSAGDNIFIAWGWCPDSGRYPNIIAEITNSAGGGTVGRWGGGQWVWNTLRNTSLGATLPPIPPEHPSLLQTSISYSHTVTTKYSSNGVPTFVSVFNRRTRSFSSPVFVGMGGPSLDGHNWPAITLDSKGYLHVVINGHHDPVMYTRSIRPYDASAWTPASYVFPETARLSYATLTCDNHDNLYTVHRSTSDKTYNNRLGLYRKRSGADWEPERLLVFPFKYMYMVWYQRMSYDRVRDRLFLTYYSRGGQQQLSQDMYEFLVFQHPDQERLLAVNQGKPSAANHGRVMPLPKPISRTGGDMYNPLAGDVATIVSSDQGGTWRLATTEDFK
ncbi:MAG: BNR-4 repeat-containing protein [Spirochaetes bacterium]|nr:BNR-4 repeat-containing protein [Spirochaetota bacterium]